MITAIAEATDATAALHKDAMDGVIDDILRENAAGHDKIDPNFLDVENQRNIIRNPLSKELAEFNITINEESVTLRLTKGFIELLFEKGKAISEAFSLRVEIQDKKNVLMFHNLS